MKTQDISIIWKESLRSTDILKKCLRLTEKQLNKHKKNDTVYEFFQVSLDHHHWTIMKSHQELNRFLNYARKQYPQNNNNKILPNSVVLKTLFFFDKHKQINIDDQEIISFLQIQDIQLHKVKSLQLSKKSGGRYVDKFCCSCSWFQWKNRHFVITQTGILYHKEKQGKKKTCQYISFNKYFQYLLGIQTGYQYGICIKSYHRKLLLTAKNLNQFIKAIYFLNKAYNDYNIVRQQNPYNAFSAPKQHNNIDFYVDGHDYFAAVAQAISIAKYQVMIAGWWISPQFHMIRPIDPKNPSKNRLNTILKQIIDKNNVKIYILAYRQSPMFLPNDSNYTKQALQQLSPNIKVITHPLNLIPSLWSHHQKIVLIDQKIAFVGGLDICYGRYDNSQHSINDKQNLFPGIEFNNSRIKDFEKVKDYQISNIMRSKHPRLPWHDISMKIVGQSVSDISRHFIQYWNFASYQCQYQQRIVLMPQHKKKVRTKIKQVVQQVVQQIKNKIFSSPQKRKMQKQKQKQNQKYKQRQKSKQNNKKKVNINVNFKQVKNPNDSINKDNTNKNMISQQMGQQNQFYNLQMKNLQNIKKLEKLEQQKSSKQDQIYRYTENDIVQKKQPSTNQTLHKLNKNNINNINIKQKNNKKPTMRKRIKKIFVPNQKNQQQYYDSDNGQYLNERSYEFEEQNQQIINRKPIHWMRKAFSNQQKNLFKSRFSGNTNTQSKQFLDNLTKIDKCQVLRSVSKWSIGCKMSQSESSIHQAYIDMIKKAQHFIYIENQFFMSAIEGEKTLKNQIAITLIQRISKAIRQKQKFRVLVFMPLIPGFAGQLDDPLAVLPRVIMYWQYLTIWRGQNSIIKSLQRLTPDPSKYIQFYGLRTHDIVNGQPRTQIIYLHSKLMIVDDRRAILGSANINDRSMRGTRDSQIAVQISDGKLVDSIVNGLPYKVNQKIRDLRVKLMKQHFGQFDHQENKLDFNDILNSKTFESLQNIAKTNTNIYRQLFGCYPDDNIQTLKQINKYRKKPSLQDYQKQKIRLQKHVVHFPYKFLSRQNLLQGNSIYPNMITT